MKSQVGWVIVEVKKKSSRAIVPCWNENGIYDSISGFGELHYKRKDAQFICNQLNSNWEGKPFKVFKAALIWGEP